jgi:hypothetical protein
MSTTTPERRRLILVGGGPRELWEPFVASVADDHELSLIAPDYPSWQAAYVEKHRIAKITNFSTLFAAVADLRGEVADAAVLTWEQGTALPVARIAERLRLRSVSVNAVETAVQTTVDGASEAELRAYAVATDGSPEVLAVVRAGAVLESWRDEPWADELDALVAAAHRSTGTDWGLTTTRLATAASGLTTAGLTTWLDEEDLPALNGSPEATRLAKASAAVLFDRDPALTAT